MCFQLSIYVCSHCFVLTPDMALGNGSQTEVSLHTRQSTLLNQPCWPVTVSGYTETGVLVVGSGNEGEISLTAEITGDDFVIVCR